MFKWLVFILFAFNLKADGQEIISFQKIDSLSYYQYSNAKWDELIETKKLAEKNNIDFFYLNLRAGIAYFNHKMFSRAEKYLSKANQQNSFDTTTLYYLYYAALENNNYFQMSKIHQDVFGYSNQITKAVGSINFDAGVKFSSDKSVAGNLTNISVGLSHLPFKNLTIYQSFTSINQSNNVWGYGKQLQYYLGSSIKLNRNWKFDIASHFYQYKAAINYQYDSSSISSTPPAFQGDYKIDSIFSENHLLKGNFSETGTILHLGITKYSKTLTFSPFVQLNLANTKNDISELEWKEIKEEKIRPMSPKTTSIVNKDSTIKNMLIPTTNKLVIGASFMYVIPYFNEKISLGLNFYQPIGKEKLKGTLSPFARIKLGKSSLFISYFTKKSYALAEFNGSVLVNSYDIIHHRINAQWSLPLNKKNTISALYQLEDKTDSFSYSRYKSSMFLLSYNFNF